MDNLKTSYQRNPHKNAQMFEICKKKADLDSRILDLYWDCLLDLVEEGNQASQPGRLLKFKQDLAVLTEPKQRLRLIQEAGNQGAAAVGGEEELGRDGSSWENLYQILEVDCSASTEEINRAFKRLAFQWHPDKNPDSREACELKFKKISHAHDVLSDPGSRAKYDNPDRLEGGQAGAAASNHFDYCHPEVVASFFEKNRISNFGLGTLAAAIGLMGVVAAFAAGADALNNSRVERHSRRNGW